MSAIHLQREPTFRPLDNDDFDFPKLARTLSLSILVTLGEPEHIPCPSRPDLYDPGSGDEVTLDSVTMRAVDRGGITLGDRRIVQGNFWWELAEAWVEQHRDELREAAHDQARDEAVDAAEYRAEVARDYGREVMA